MAYLDDTKQDTPEAEQTEEVTGPDDPTQQPAQPKSEHVSSTELTRREVEVLRLVAAGLTNKQVAGELGLSTYTIESHLRSVYRKLKITTRGAAIRYAFEHDIA
jgi:DNA-binding NarL/FixJ family response regulator